MYIVKPFSYMFMMNYWLLIKGAFNVSYNKYNFEELIQSYRKYLERKRYNLNEDESPDKNTIRKIDEYLNIVDKIKVHNGEINGVSFSEIEKENRVLNDLPISRNDIIFMLLISSSVIYVLSLNTPLFKVVFFDDLLVHLTLITSVSIIAAALVDILMGLIGVGDVHMRFFEQVRRSCIASYFAFLFFKSLRFVVKFSVYSFCIITLFLSPVLFPSQDNISVCFKNGDEVVKAKYNPIYNTSHLTLFKKLEENINIDTVESNTFKNLFVMNNSSVIGFGEDVHCIDNSDDGSDYLNIVEELSKCELTDSNVLFKAHVYFGSGEPLIHKRYDPNYNNNIKPKDIMPWRASLNRGRDDNNKGKPELKKISIELYVDGKTESRVIELQDEASDEFHYRTNPVQYYLDHFEYLREKLFTSIDKNINNKNNMRLFLVSYTDHRGSSLDNLSLSDRRIQFTEYAFGINCFNNSSESCKRRVNLLSEIDYYPIPFSEISYVRLRNISDKSADDSNKKLRVAKVLLCK